MILTLKSLTLCSVVYQSLWNLRCSRRWRSWLMYCATSRKVAGSIPDDVFGIFDWYNPSGRTMALGSSQPVCETSTMNIYCGKSDQCVWLTTLPPSCADCLEIWEPQPSGTLRPVLACTEIALLFTVLNIVVYYLLNYWFVNTLFRDAISTSEFP